MVIFKAGEQSGGPSFLETPSHQSPPPEELASSCRKVVAPGDNPRHAGGINPKTLSCMQNVLSLSLIVCAHPDPSYPKLLYQGPQIKRLTRAEQVRETR